MTAGRLPAPPGRPRKPWILLSMRICVSLLGLTYLQLCREFPKTGILRLASHRLFDTRFSHFALKCKLAIESALVHRWAAAPARGCGGWGGAARAGAGRVPQDEVW